MSEWAQIVVMFLVTAVPWPTAVLLWHLHLYAVQLRGFAQQDGLNITGVVELHRYYRRVLGPVPRRSVRVPRDA
jgi:hypothetical protein